MQSVALDLKTAPELWKHNGLHLHFNAVLVMEKHWNLDVDAGTKPWVRPLLYGPHTELLCIAPLNKVRPG